MRKQFPFSLIILSSLLITTCEKNPVDSSIQEQYKIAFAEDSLFVINSDGSDQRGIFPLSFGSFGVLWSPDGSKISFDEYATTINIINTDGTNHKRLIGTRGGVSNYSWSPDGEKIVYGIPDTIYIMNINDLSKQILTTGGRLPKWSPKENKIAYVKDEALYIMKSDGSSQIKVSDTLRIQRSFWSLDGKKIGLIGSSGNIPYVLNADGTNKIKQINTGCAVRYFALSPDGSEIAYSCILEPDVLFIMNSDGSNVQRLTISGNYGFPTWSPDGSKIAYSSNDGIFLINPDGTGKIRLTSKTASFQTAWSPVPLP